MHSETCVLVNEVVHLHASASGHVDNRKDFSGFSAQRRHISLCRAILVTHVRSSRHVLQTAALRLE